MQDRIVALATVLGRREESEALSLLCAEAERELKSRLRAGLTAEACGDAFPLAAAWLALAKLCAAEEDEVESLTAGDVTIRRRESEYRRKALELQAEQVMKPYIKDEGFSFLGVRS